MSAARAKARVVVDGSNIATEGRVTPSLAQLDEAVRAYIEENPGADVIVVVDATFEHRVPASERSAFGEAILAGEVVTPPAGAIGRGDAFILKIADRIDAVVLSNDSFQEFQEEYPWLFDEGRLVGGKPVRGVGWVFTTRLPVRSPKVLRQANKAAKAAAEPTAKRAAKKAPAKAATPAKAPAKRATRAAKAEPVAKPAPAAKAEPPAKAKRAAKAAPVEPTAKRAAKKAPAKAAATPAKAPAKRAAKSTPPPVALAGPTAKRAAKKATPPAPEAPEPAVALRRGRHPVNPEPEFTRFLAAHRIGAKLTGEVVTFTSHGAVVTVEVRGGGRVECYAPTASLGSPPPARARDVLTRGERHAFRLVAVDPERRIAELALA